MLQKRSRRLFVASSAGALGSIGILRYPAGAAQFSYKLHIDRPANDPFVVQLTAAVGRILSQSGGQLEIKIFPNNALGGNTKVLPLVREGAVEFAMIVDVIVSDIAPSAAIDGVGFAFPNYKAGWDAMDGPLGAYVRGAIERDMGVYAFQTVWDAGFKEVSNSAHPINRADDMKGLKIRATPGAISVSLFKTLGASPVAIDSTEMYSAEQTHLVDGADTTATLLLSGSFYDVQKYLALTNHSLVIYHVLAAQGPWQNLPKNLRDLTEHHFELSAKALRAQSQRDMDEALTALRGKGMAISQPDLGSFRDALRAGGYYGYWKDKFGAQAWGILEKAVGRLA